MAAAKQVPIIDPVVGASALAEDLPRVLSLYDATSVEQLGWRQPNSLTLLIPFRGVRQGVTTEFLLKLGFQAYRTWPPSAQFVNPETLRFDRAADAKFLPKLTSQQCHTHLEYQCPNGSKVQLICCSATLEFYDVLHDVQPEHMWRENYTFNTTINAIRAAFASKYEGTF